MLDPVLRRIKDRALTPLAAMVPRLVHPTWLTLTGGALGLAAAFAAATGHLAGGLLLWWGNRLADGLDGLVARVQGRQRALGGYLDLLVDFGVYAAIPIGLAWGDGRSATLWGLVALLALYYLNSASWLYLAAVLERRGQGAESRGEVTSVTFPEGLIGGSETIVAYSTFFLLPTWLPHLFLGFTALIGLTVVQRFWWARTHLSGR